MRNKTSNSLTRKSRCKNFPLSFMFRSIHDENTLSRKSSKDTSRDFRFDVFSGSGKVGYGRRGKGNDSTTAKGDICEESRGMGERGEGAGVGLLEESQLCISCGSCRLNSVTGRKR